MMKNKQPTQVNIQATLQQQHAASAKNRRLAQQMENRPSVQAALKIKQQRSLNLKQRLGPSNIQARLGGPVNHGGMGMGVGMPPGGMGMVMGGMGGIGMGGRVAMGVRGRGGLGNRGVIRGNLRLNRGGPRGGGLLMRGAGRGLLRGGMRGAISTRGRGGMVGRGRGRGFLARGRGIRGRGRGAPQVNVTREQLDNQLDAYMSKTKGYMDAELDAYMAEADADE